MSTATMESPATAQTLAITPISEDALSRFTYNIVATWLVPEECSAQRVAFPQRRAFLQLSTAMRVLCPKALVKLRSQTTIEISADKQLDSAEMKDDFTKAVGQIFATLSHATVTVQMADSASENEKNTETDYEPVESGSIECVSAGAAQRGPCRNYLHEGETYGIVRVPLRPEEQVPAAA